MSTSWVVVWAVAVALALWMVVRGIQALQPGSSGALWCFFYAVAIMVAANWAYTHRKRPDMPRKGNKQ